MVSEDCIDCSHPHDCKRCKLYKKYTKQVKKLENKDWDKLLKKHKV